MKTIVLLIPALNEIQNLKFNLKNIVNSFEKNFKDYEKSIIIVDGINFDIETKTLCDELDCIYLNRQPKNLFGDAFRSGLNFIQNNLPNTDWLITMDADNSHNPKTFETFRSVIDAKNPDVIIASRYIIGGVNKNKILSIFLSRLVNFVFRILFSLKIKDVSNNFRVYKFNLINQIELTQNNFEIVEEIIIKLHKINSNLKVIEVPSVFEKRLYGKSKRSLIKFTFSYLMSIFRLKKL